MYEITLYHGWTEDDGYGVEHSFILADPDGAADSDEICKSLAEDLGVDELEDDVESGRFNYDSIELALPDSVVAKIKADAVKEYLADRLFPKHK